MQKLSLLAIFVLAFMTFAAVSSLIQPAHADSARCKALESADLSGIPDAPTQVMAATAVAAAGDIPAYCQVRGYVTPNVGFEIRLPESQWNGKFFLAGCGAWCGEILFEPFCDSPLHKGYACIATDQGHKSTLGDLKWAYNNLQAEIDYAYRADHVVALAGKVITERYYRKAPNHSYIMGCSGGGREGMVEAQRFPWDFDGIVSGAPAVNITGNGMNLLSAPLAMHDRDGKAILSIADIQLVHRAAVAKCDMDDDIKDGLIGNPVACAFDPAELSCKPSQKNNTKDAGCLTPAQVAAVKKVYMGPATSEGEPVYSGGALPGSELNWSGYLKYYTPANGPWISDLFKYMMFMPDPGPTWQPKDFDFNRDYKRLGMMESLYTAENPDLRKFQARGGRLISYMGWADDAVVPREIVNYYETVERTMGGRAATQEFFRLFMLPGVDHCVGGEGANTVDYLSYLENWVEHGQAPDMMLSAHVKDGRVSSSRPDTRAYPVPPSDIAFTRPVFPYPRRARYLGAGDPNDAANFGPVDP